ncbi:hypothetical protein, partial [Sphingomonas adhaesiva]|uniref:hypothetical protein n=1 Tax=Sphingomonas adhaesiva TaxID=28212 RepID=UPI001C3F9D8F
MTIATPSPGLSISTGSISTGCAALVIVGLLLPRRFWFRRKPRDGRRVAIAYISAMSDATSIAGLTLDEAWEGFARRDRRL